MKRDSLAIPAAIVIAAGLIAAAIYLNGAKGPTQPLDFGGGSQVADPTAPVIKQVDAKTDHIRGNPNAPIMLVEYSDYDCPFCDIFHDTLLQVMDEYGPSGKVAMVFRHFPIKQLHANAPKIAEASECVAELGGNGAFWKFTDSIFASKTVDRTKGVVEFTDMSKLPGFAEAAGVDKAAFESCLASGKYADKIAASIQEAAASGGKGTPHTLILVGEQSFALNGAEEFKNLKGILDNLIRQMDGGAQ